MLTNTLLHSSPSHFVKINYEAFLLLQVDNQEDRIGESTYNRHCFF
jgi:hypothetical protein